MAEVRKKKTVSNYLLFFVLLLIVAAAAVLLLPVYRNYQNRQAELNSLNARLAEEKIERARLNREVGGLQNSPDTVEKVAREKFGLVRKGESVLKYQSPEKSR